ncbi:hypothetical protein SM021_004260, partial [Cronobacter muytjensii]|nr:hypothetical protein [Cronobacter muytjensii]
MGSIVIFIVIGLILYLGVKKFSPDVSNEHDEQDEHTRKRNESTKRIIEAELEKARLYDERKRNTPKRTRKQRTPKKALKGLPLKITYEDAAGDITVRDISVIKYDSSSQKTYAWCYA